MIKDAEYGIEQLCEAISEFSDECLEEKDSCQYMDEGIITNERAIRKYIQILNVFQRICTFEDVPASEIIISCCKIGENWNTFNPVYDIYSYLNEAAPKSGNHELDKRALSTLAVVAISTIVGSLATAGLALAMDNIAKAEVTRIMKIEANTRGIQNEQNNVTVAFAA